MGLLGKGVNKIGGAAKGLLDVVDDRFFYHSTDADFDQIKPSDAYRGAGIFGHESAEATGKYGKRTIPFKVRGKIADESPDGVLNKEIKKAGLVPLADESSRDAYRRLIEQASEQDVQSIFKSAGYGAYSRPTKKGDIVQAFDTDTVIQMDDKGGLLSASGLGESEYYHGTASNIQEFSKGMRGTGTEASSAEKAFWFSDDPEYTARSYADHSATTNRVTKLLKEADEAERTGNWDLYDQKIVEAEELEGQFMSNPQSRLRGQNIIPAHLPKDDDLIVIDMKGQSFSDQGVSKYVSDTLDAAKADGKKGVKFLNLDDAIGHYDKPATHVAVFDEGNIRSKFAKLDPSKRGEAGMMKSALTPTIGAGLLGLGALAQSDESEAGVVGGILGDILGDFAGDTVKQAKKAGWTDERISRAIRDMSHVRGDVAKGRVGHVNPKEFVEATHPDYSQIKKEAGLLDVEKLRNEDQIPFINVEDGKIVGHEGRHRMAAMHEQGIDSAPVMIRDVSGYSSENVPAQKFSALLEGQDLADGKVGKPLSVTDTILASESNKGAIKGLMGDSDLLYSSPIMGGTAGLLGLTALAPDDVRAAEIAATDIRDVGSIQAANHPKLQALAGLLSQIDTPIGKPFENIPSSLLAMAYGDDPDLLRSFLSATDIAP